jgi:acetylornithine deacetylase/succinyl-diaminopimelate desuccinylase-like protein
VERTSPLNHALNLPSLNINGIQSAGVGKQSANVIPVKAIASLDLRLVVGNDWKRQQQKVIDHIREQGFYVTENEPTDLERSTHDKICMVKRSSGYNAQKTPLDDAFAQRVVHSVRKGTGEEPLLLPTLGGSLPLQSPSPITITTSMLKTRTFGWRISGVASRCLPPSCYCNDER